METFFKIAFILISFYFFYKNRTKYSGLIYVIILLATLLTFTKLILIVRVLYWISLLLISLYMYVENKNKNSNKLLYALYVLPFIIHEVSFILNLPMYLSIRILFFLPFLVYIVMCFKYKEFKNEFGFLTLIIGLNLITVLLTYFL